MEQLYLLEIFIDKLSIFIKDGDKQTNTHKDLYIRVMFGTKTQFIFRESQLVFVKRSDEIIKERSQSINEEPEVKNKGSKSRIDTKKSKEDINQNDEQFVRWSRTYRVGHSLLFPAFPDHLHLLLEQYPLEFYVWSGDEDEEPELLGVGNMHWHTQYFSHLKENTHYCLPHKALSIKEIIPIFNDCCCKKLGELQLVIRLTPLGNTITTEFQQLLDEDPDKFVFRTDKCTSLFECKRIEADNKEYNTEGSLYEVALREDPDVRKNIHKKIEVCTELESCGIAQEGLSFACQHRPGLPSEQSPLISPKIYPIDKIRMGDIVGPCGNANCLIAHRMRTFIRNQYAYKKETLGQTFSKKSKQTLRVCGQCGCKHDLWHSEKAQKLAKKPVCAGCGGVAQTGQTCDDRLKNLFGTGVTPISSKTDLSSKKDHDKGK